ncbi:putative sterigmatocystin biosynthesis P450 monooxygenase [Lachnellula cervina]|uniref:Putative sterigmatocystin biosynthesis P450 monooxygenase n=1 Tax=Lachnellula cervina TaxID=1316786 RepID=A0A7D8Z459_9HELO|nr:putative sterigmatocystin biosynthesis P450 monooxygenase [Lachnellula cervina]
MLYPPASTTRSAEPGYLISGPNSAQLPTDGFIVWSNAYAIYRNGKYWPEPERFLPERWLVDDNNRLYPLKALFVHFLFRPRNWIGQELALLELRIVLTITAREFNIKSVYVEWDKLHPTKAVKTLNGD